MYIICGLGNPGKKYEFTRHNIGFLTIDYLAKEFNIKVEKLKFKALIGEGMIGPNKVMLVKPQTFMNLSGESIREIMDYYKEPVSNLLVIYDDIDLETGTYRIRKKGSSGTHNGMRNIIYQLQDDNFPRIRIGMGSFLERNLIDYVTGVISKQEEELIYPLFESIKGAVSTYVTDGIDMAMNRYNINKKKEEGEE